MEELFKEFKEITKPVVDFIIKHYDPHTTIIITENQCKVVKDDISIPKQELNKLLQNTTIANESDNKDDDYNIIWRCMYMNGRKFNTIK